VESAGMLHLLDVLSSWAKAIASYIATTLIAFVAFILILQVVLRYIFMFSLPWPEEAARYAMIWVVLLMGSVLMRDRELVTVDFFDRLWSRKIILYRNLIYRVLLLAVLYVLFKEGLSQAVAGWRMRTTALEMRWFWPYLSIPVGAGLMIVQMICLSIEEAHEFLRKRNKND
jgi:TRAP-type C4-dicarboxylate transport system permease small subunit